MHLGKLANGIQLINFLKNNGTIPCMSSKKDIKSQYNYLIIGAGRQGTAAAYDLAKFGDARSITLADKDIGTAEKSAKRINDLIGKSIAEGTKLDASNRIDLRSLMVSKDAVLSAVPYYFNLDITLAALESNVHLCDMGGHTETVWKQLAFNRNAQEAGISIIPDCGMGPGLINTMGAYVFELLDEVKDIIIYDAGLPQQMQPPWYYKSTFNLNGLTNEMNGKSTVLRDGKITLIDTLTEPEMVNIPNIGILEADLISGGASTAPWSFEGKLQRYENKTLRHPKHWEWMRAFKTLGLFSEESIEIEGKSVIPRQVFHTLLAYHLNEEIIKDIAIIQVKATGKKNGNNSTLFIDLLDYYDESTGFTAMERLTGWHCAIMMGFQVRGEIEPGSKPVETAILASKFMSAIKERNIQYQIRYSS